MSTFKPFIRITILSFILALLLIYLGVKYHWVDYFKEQPSSSLALVLPEQANTVTDTLVKAKVYNPELLKDDRQNTLLDSMNKEQMTAHCKSLLSKQINDPIMLELATANCVVSNYDETYQQVDNNVLQSEADSLKKQQLVQQCKPRYSQSNEYTLIEKELLIGICISDNLNKQQ